MSSAIFQNIIKEFVNCYFHLKCFQVTLYSYLKLVIILPNKNTWYNSLGLIDLSQKLQEVSEGQINENTSKCQKTLLHLRHIEIPRRGVQIRAAAACLHHIHSNARSNVQLRPKPKLWQHRILKTLCLGQGSNLCPGAPEMPLIPLRYRGTPVRDFYSGLLFVLRQNV